MNSARAIAACKAARRAGFTLIEVMLAIAILAVIIGAIYSTWVGIVKAARVGQDAAAVAQRERMAIRVVEEALAGAQLFVANPKYYSFELDGDATVPLNFVSILPQAFPRSGKFGEARTRRVMFAVEAGPEGQKQLVLRQSPILMEMDEDEQTHPVVLAARVKKFTAEAWDPTANEWTSTWQLTNQLPKMVRVILQLDSTTARGGVVAQLPLATVVGLPTAGVQPNFQLPTLNGGNPGAPGGPGGPGGPVNPGNPRNPRNGTGTVTPPGGPGFNPIAIPGPGGGRPPRPR